MDKYENLQGMRIGFIGFGDIAEKAVFELNRAHSEKHFTSPAEVWGFRRKPEKITHLLAPNHAVYIDVTKPESLIALTQTPIDYWVVTLTPPALSEDDYRGTYVDGLAAILSALHNQTIKKIFWVSSSSVYGQENDEWVDETSATLPQRFSGKIQLEAEQLLKGDSRACVLRFSGIYRQEQHRMVNSLKEGKLASRCEEDYFTNRIHVVDAARSILHLMNCDAGGLDIQPLYLASDSSPVKYLTLIRWLSKTSGLALNDEMPAAKKRINSKRCSNSRLKKTGFNFLFDTYKDGFSSYL